MDKNKVISIEFFGSLRATLKIERVHLPFTENMVVADVLEYMHNRYPAVTLDKDHILATVNHEVAAPDRHLKANDTVCFVPHIGGG